ncbi:MAG TPA: lysozyme [Rhizomicrobium sp.]|jgi:lysozyme
MTRILSQNGRLLVERNEGLRLQAYPDQGGIWTIGYGHTHGVKPGDVCTQAQAEAWLEQDLTFAQATVESLVKVPLTDNQFAALVSFAFNVGAGKFAGSTLLKRLNAGNYAGVPQYLTAWVFCDGKVNDGLVQRRAREAALWRTT